MLRRGRALDRSAVDAVLAPLARARPLPGRAYVDRDVFDFEQDRIFGRSWVVVGREEEVGMPGEWFRTTVASEPILVVRGADLRVRGFLDVCRHRGASLVSRATSEPRRLAQLECPYHGWTYELDGKLRSAPFAPPSFDRATHGLCAVRIEAWGGFLFVTLDSDVGALEAWMGELPPWLDATTLAMLRRGSRSTYDVAANWKLLVENFQESHHFARVHPALERLTPSRGARTWLGAGRWLGGTMAIEDAETVSVDGDLHERPRIVPIWRSSAARTERPAGARANRP